MTEILYIRLGSQQQDAVQWLIWSTAEQAVVDLGELASAQVEQLQLLAEKTTNRKVVVWVPGSSVNLKALKVPGKSQRAIRLAAPYMLEDDLAQDVEQLFFAYGNVSGDEQGNNCFVCAVEKRLLENWLAWLSDAGIDTKVITPDVFSLPVVEKTDEHGENETVWQAVAVDQQILIRQSLWQVSVIDSEVWPLASSVWQKNAEQDEALITLNVLSALPGVESSEEQSAPEQNLEESLENPIGLKVTATEVETDGLALLAKYSSASANKPLVNLLQGEFKVVEKRSPAATHWLWAVSFMLVAFLFTLSLKGIELVNKQGQVAAIEQEIVKTYKKAFPQTKRVRINAIKSQLKGKLRNAGTGGASDSFLPMLTKLQPAFTVVPDMEISSLKFDGKKQEIRLQVTGSDFQVFEKFSAAVEKMRLTVKQGAQNNKDGRISGSFSISN